MSEEFGFSESDFTETPDRLMERTSQLLSALSNNVGIVVSPSLADDRLQHIEFVNLSDNRVLVVLVSAPNIVHNKIIRLKNALSNDELDRTARFTWTALLIFYRKAILPTSNAFASCCARSARNHV
jgi:transcriptional regulator of heat shock response